MFLATDRTRTDSRSPGHLDTTRVYGASHAGARARARARGAGTRWACGVRRAASGRACRGRYISGARCGAGTLPLWPSRHVRRRPRAARVHAAIVRAGPGHSRHSRSTSATQPRGRRSMASARLRVRRVPTRPECARRDALKAGASALTQFPRPRAH